MKIKSMMLLNYLLRKHDGNKANLKLIKNLARDVAKSIVFEQIEINLYFAGDRHFLTFAGAEDFAENPTIQAKIYDEFDAKFEERFYNELDNKIHLDPKN